MAVISSVGFSQEHKLASSKIFHGRVFLSASASLSQDSSGPACSQRRARIVEVALARQPHRISYPSLCNKQINNEERRRISL